MPLNLPIYLDHHATTPVDQRVLEAMLPLFTTNYGNASSKTHSFGRAARELVEASRARIAKSIRAKPKEIVFTSGATEAINLALKGIFRSEHKTPPHFVTAKTEHKALLDCHCWLESEGCQVTYVGVDCDGVVNLDELEEALRTGVTLTSVMAANNETGVVQPVTEIGSLCRQHGSLFFTDATQALGKMALAVDDLNADLLAASAHKLYGPKGCGFLYVRSKPRRARPVTQLHGGGHERGLRSGTLNTPGIVGMAEAIDLCLQEMTGEQQRLRGLRDRLLSGLQNALEGVVVNGSLDRRLAMNLNVSFPGVEAEALMMGLREDLAISTGSACTSEKIEPSHVLSAMGLAEDRIFSSVRFGLGRSTNEAEIDHTVVRVAQEVKRLRGLRIHTTSG